MKKFDTIIQELKHKTLSEIIRNMYSFNSKDLYIDIPKKISPGPQATMRCCVFKERAIIQERIKLALGGNKTNANIMEVIDIACDECPIGGIYVTPACRGCLRHDCQNVCPKDAIAIIEKRAVVDKDKCIECGKCINACLYGAIIHQHRPCKQSCVVKAIAVDQNGKASIDNDKCVQCGACQNLCPFGAIQDKSFILKTINLLVDSDDNQKFKVFAVTAPSIATQFPEVSLGQVVSAIKQIGFFDVVDASVGAEEVLRQEYEELKTKDILITSCCPSFVDYVKKNHPTLVPNISHSLSPMLVTAQKIKEKHPGAKVVFIGPCTSKKGEIMQEGKQGFVDNVMSFEELFAFVCARDIDMAALPSSKILTGDTSGKAFAASGGIAAGVAQMAKENGEEIEVVAMNGLEQCKMNLLLLKAKRHKARFFEGMACEGGCINGSLCMYKGKDKPKMLSDYAKHPQ